LSYPSSLLRPPPTPSRLPSTSLASVIGRQAARAADPRPRRASPVPRTTFWPFHALYAGRFLGTRSRFPGAFRGLRPFGTGSAPPCSALSRGPALRRLSGFTLVADRPVATAFMRCRRSASTPRSLSTSGTSYRGPWRLLGPDSHRLAALSLSLGYVMSTSLSSWRPSCWTHPEFAGSCALAIWPAIPYPSSTSIPGGGQDDSNGAVRHISPGPLGYTDLHRIVDFVRQPTAYFALREVDGALGRHPWPPSR